MCGGVEYDWQGQTRRTFFPNPNAQVPVVRKDGDIELVTWGRRTEEDSADAQGFPINGWVRHESFLNPNSSWRQYRHKEVKIAIKHFMEKDDVGKSHWFSLQEDEYLRGLLLVIEKRWRVYVLTTEPPKIATPYIQNQNGIEDLFGALPTEPVRIHERWPMTGRFASA